MVDQYSVILLIALSGVCIYILGRLDGRDANYTRRDVNYQWLYGYLTAQYRYQQRYKGCIRHDPKTGQFMKAGGQA